MSRSKSGAGPFEFTRAAWEEIRLSEHAYNVSWETELTPSKQLGVWVVRTRVYDTAPGALPVPVVRYQAEWPSARVQSFEAFLYGVCHCCARMVEEWSVGALAERERARG